MKTRINIDFIKAYFTRDFRLDQNVDKVCHYHFYNRSSRNGKSVTFFFFSEKTHIFLNWLSRWFFPDPQRIRTRATKVPALRVVGGEPGNIKDLPYQANILLHGQHFCGGSIISPKLILTAGHCVCEQMPSALKVITGSTYAGNGIMSDIGRIFCHEEYNKNEGDLPVNDIAILDLKIPLK